MRSPAVIAVALAACGSNPRPPESTPPQRPAVTQALVPASVATPVAATPAPPPPPIAEAPALPTFTQPTTLYRLVGGSKPVCEAWTIDVDRQRLVNTRPWGKAQVTRTVGFEVHGTQLKLIDQYRFEDGDENTASSSTCGWEPTEIRETDEALVLADGGKLFRTAERCATAITQREAVAASLCEMELEPDSTVDPHEPTQKKFEAVLARGGTLYSPVEGPQGATCKAIKVRPTRKSGASLQGNFSWRFVDDSGRRGTEEYGYQLSSRRVEGDGDWRMSRLVLLGPSVSWDDGGGSAYGCGDEQWITYGPGVVHVQAPMYFTARACRAQIAEDEARARWHPSPPGEEVAELPAHVGSPSLGGC